MITRRFFRLLSFQLLLLLQFSAFVRPADDFDDVNSILRDVIVKLPDIPTVESGGYSIDLTDVVCRNLSMQDASLTSQSVGLVEESYSGVQLQWSIEGLTFECDARYRYKGLLGLVNNGDVYLNSRNNRVVTTATVSTPLYGSPQPPTNVAMNSCTPEVQIVDIDFENGGVIGWFLDTIEGLLRTAVENSASDKICEELQKFWDVNTADFLEYIAGDDVLKPYLPTSTTSTSMIDPWQYEADFIQNLMISVPTPTSSTTDLLNFQEQDTSTGRWINELIQKGVDLSNEMVPSELGIIAEEELRVNQWLRDFVLEDETGALVLASSSTGPNRFPGNGILYDDEDRVTHTKIVLDRVKLLGLDTLTMFSLLEAVGNFTLETKLAWRYLAIELDATMIIRPSTRPDSMIEATTSSSAIEIVEKVTLVLGVDGLETGASLITPLNRTALENNVKLGSLLKSGEAAIDCLLSTILDLEFATLSLIVTNGVLTPSIDGLVSPGLDRLFSQVMDASFLLYEDIIMDSAPAYFQNELRPMLTKTFLHEYVLLNDQDVGDKRNSRECLPLIYESGANGGSVGSKMIDFRDLLLPTEGSISLGGSGSKMYGDVFSGIIMPYINDELLDLDALNSQVIPTITKEQSGKEGVLQFNNVFRYFNRSSSSPLFDSLDCRISKVTISNIDTVEGPLKFLQPIDSSNVLQNRIAMNTVEDSVRDGVRYLNITVRMYLEIDGDDSPFRMKNELDFSVSIPSTSLSFSIVANLNEKSFLEFPLKDIFNSYCWLAALGSPGNSSKVETERKELAISDLSFSLSTFYLNSYCVSASSPGCGFISEVIDHIEDAGMASTFRNSIVGLVENIAFSLWRAIDIDGLIKASPKYCPHSESYNPERMRPSPELSVLSGISKSSSETILALGIIGLQTAIIISAKNHLLVKQQVSPSPLLNQSSNASSVVTSFPEGSGIIDWTNLSGQFGGWIDVLFDEFRETLSKPSASLSGENIFLGRDLSPETSPRVNVLLRDYILDSSGYLELQLDDITVTTLGISISVTKVRIGGLDTITRIEPLLVVDPYEMRTTLQVDELIMTLQCNITTVDDLELNQVELEYKAENILFEIDTIIALNTTDIGQIRIGSFFDSSNIFDCMMRGIQVFEIERLNLTIGEIQSFSISDSFSSELQSDLSGILDSLRTEYQNEILSAVPLIAESTIREIMNKMIPGFLESRAMECPSPPEFASNGLIDFRELFLPDPRAERVDRNGTSSYGDLFEILYSTLDKQVMQTGASNRPVLNDLVKTLTKIQSNTTGTINVAGTALDTQSTIEIAGLRADIRFEIMDVKIQNLDSVGDPLYLLRPDDEEANVLHNKVSFGVDSKPIQFEGTLILSAEDGADMNIRNEINLSFLVEDVTVQTSIVLKLLENSISSFPLEDFLDLNCWAATILPPSNEGKILEGLHVLDQVFSTGNYEMEISCNSCTSPEFDKFISSLYEPSDITAAIGEQTDSLMSSDFAQRFLKDILVESKKQCPHRPEFEPDYDAFRIADSNILLEFGPKSIEKMKNPLYFSIANSIVASCLILLGIFSKFLLVRRNKKWIRSLTNEGQFLLHCQQEKQRRTDEWLDENTISLFTSPYIPKKIRWGVPMLLLVNMALYLGGHFGLLSVVNLDITFAGQSFTVEKFLEFQFWESTRKTFDNGGAEMTILLWIFTGIMPYIKIVLSLALWMTPPKYLSVKRRRTVLLWIDALVRLSIIDIFTLIVGFAILLVFIGGRDSSIDVEGMNYTLKAIVVPKAGCYCMIIAQRMSRVSSQFFLEYHGRVVEKATRVRKSREEDICNSQVLVEDQPGRNTSVEMGSSLAGVVDVNNSICKNSRSDLATQGSRIPTDLSFFKITSWKAYRWGHLGAIFGGITILIVFIIGLVFVPAIAFDISTFGGISLESDYTYEEAVSEYGVFLVMSGILLKARFVLKTRANYVGLGLLLIVAGMSVSFMFVMKSFHFIRQKIRERRDRNEGQDLKPSYGHEGCGLPSFFRLYKWNHMEIYFISLSIGVWQLGSIVSYSIHLYCYILAGIFDVLTSIGIVKPTEAQCYRIQALLVGNLTITIGSSFILLAVFFVQAYDQYRKNLVHALKYIDDKDVPTLSLGWSQDKSKNKRYSHLTDILSPSFTDSDAGSLMTGKTSITNPSHPSLPQRSESIRDHRSGSFFTASSAMGDTSMQLNPSDDTIEECLDEDEILLPITSMISDRACIWSNSTSTTDSRSELVNASNSHLTETGIKL